MSKELFKRIVSSILLLPLALFFILKGNLFFNFFILICFVISVYEWFNMTRKKKYFIFGLFFLLVAFFSLYEIRKFDDYNPSYLLTVLIICMSTDIGGYCFGKIFKGPKLTKLSPNKTFSGMFGGYFFSLISIILLNNSSLLFIFNSDIFSVFFIFLISSISQIGDITVSTFKRLSNQKDTGKIIPGHGGLLDRIDGMIFAFPLSYLIYKFVAL